MQVARFQGCRSLWFRDVQSGTTAGFQGLGVRVFLSLAGVSLVSLSYIRDLNLQLGYVSSDGLSFVKRSSDDPGDETDVITKCWG